MGRTNADPRRIFLADSDVRPLWEVHCNISAATVNTPLTLPAQTGTRNRSRLAAMSRSVALMLVLGLAGCASVPQPQQILTPFFDDDFQTWKQSGPYTVTGQAFLKLPDGRTPTCAGGEVSLLPAVGYNTELEKILETGKGFPSNYERNARKYEYKALCDAAGKFVFTGIPALNWIVLTRIGWQEPSSTANSTPDMKGGWLFKELLVGDNRTTVTLTNPDFVADTK